jgi:hypothetical protein
MRMRATFTLAAGLAFVLAAGCKSEEPKTQKMPEDETQGRAVEQTFRAKGKEPAFQVIPAGEPVFQPEPGTRAFPHELAIFSSNQVEKVQAEISIEAIDRGNTEPATGVEGVQKLTDEAKVSGWFRLKDGSYCTFRLERLATASEFGLGEKTHFGGVATNILMNGNSGNGNPYLPKVKAGVAIWGFGRIEKDGELLAANAPIQVYVSTRERDRDSGKYLGRYDSTQGEIGEVHLVVLPASAGTAQKKSGGYDSTLPAGEKGAQAGGPAATPGVGRGFHIVWENVEVVKK